MNRRNGIYLGVAIALAIVFILVAGWWIAGIMSAPSLSENARPLLTSLSTKYYTLDLEMGGEFRGSELIVFLGRLKPNARPTTGVDTPSQSTRPASDLSRPSLELHKMRLICELNGKTYEDTYDPAAHRRLVHIPIDALGSWYDLTLVAIGEDGKEIVREGRTNRPKAPSTD